MGMVAALLVRKVIVTRAWTITGLGPDRVTNVVIQMRIATTAG